jgi:hypothetical protein
VRFSATYVHTYFVAWTSIAGVKSEQGVPDLMSVSTRVFGLGDLGMPDIRLL